MKLAEFEAETICNLERENFKLSDALSSAEETIERERENKKYLENELKVNDSMSEIPVSFKLLFLENNRQTRIGLCRGNEKTSKI